MQALVGVMLLCVTVALIGAAITVLVRGRRRHPKGQLLPTSVTGTVLVLSLLALVTGAYGFVELFGAALDIGVALGAS